MNSYQIILLNRYVLIGKTFKIRKEEELEGKHILVTGICPLGQVPAPLPSSHSQSYGYSMFVAGVASFSTSRNLEGDIIGLLK